MWISIARFVGLLLGFWVHYPRVSLLSSPLLRCSFSFPARIMIFSLVMIMIRSQHLEWESLELEVYREEDLLKTWKFWSSGHLNHVSHFFMTCVCVTFLFKERWFTLETGWDKLFHNFRWVGVIFLWIVGWNFKGFHSISPFHVLLVFQNEKMWVNKSLIIPPELPTPDPPDSIFVLRRGNSSSYSFSMIVFLFLMCFLMRGGGHHKKRVSNVRWVFSFPCSLLLPFFSSSQLLILFTTQL